MTNTTNSTPVEDNFLNFDEYDDAIATDGVWFEGVNLAGKSYGKFLCRLINGDLPATKMFQQRLSRQNKKNQSQTEDELIEQTIRMFVDCSLLDWKMKGKDGTMISFDKKTAFKFFSNTKTHRMLMHLIEYASDVDNYQPDDEVPEKK